MTNEELILKNAKELIQEAQQQSENPDLESIDKLGMELTSLLSIVNQYYIEHHMKGEKFKILGKDMLEIVRGLRRMHETLIEERKVTRS